MALDLGDNIKLNAQQPNFVRDVIATKDTLISSSANHKNNYEIGHIVYCTEVRQHFIYCGPNGGSTSILTNRDKTWGEFCPLSAVRYQNADKMLADVNNGYLPVGTVAMVGNEFYYVSEQNGLKSVHPMSSSLKEDTVLFTINGVNVTYGSDVTLSSGGGSLDAAEEEEDFSEYPIG